MERFFIATKESIVANQMQFYVTLTVTKFQSILSPAVVRDSLTLTESVNLTPPFSTE